MLADPAAMVVEGNVPMGGTADEVRVPQDLEVVRDERGGSPNADSRALKGREPFETKGRSRRQRGERH